MQPFVLLYIRAHAYHIVYDCGAYFLYVEEKILLVCVLACMVTTVHVAV